MVRNVLLCAFVLCALLVSNKTKAQTTPNQKTKIAEARQASAEEVSEEATAMPRLFQADCLTHSEIQGSPAGTEFNDKISLSTEITEDMRPFAYHECNDNRGILESFQLFFSNTEGTNRRALKIHGPKPNLRDETSTAPTRPDDSFSQCRGYSFASKEVIKAAIYSNSTQVYGVRLLTPNGPVDLGSVNEGQPVLQEFSDQLQFVGFFGTYDDKAITSLGFVTFDPECMPSEKIVVKEESLFMKVIGETNIALIVALVIGGLALIALIVGNVVYKIYKKAKTPKKTKKGSVKEGQQLPKHPDKTQDLAVDDSFSFTPNLDVVDEEALTKSAEKSGKKRVENGVDLSATTSINMSAEQIF